MKKIFIVALLLIFTKISFCQNLSYGVILNNNILQLIETKTPYTSTNFKGTSNVSEVNLNYGGYLEYLQKNKISFRGSILYGKKEDQYYDNLYSERFKIEVTTLQINPVIKYSFGKNYDKSFYMYTGPRIVFVLDTKEENIEVIDFYKKINYGAQLGFGINFLKYFGLELNVFQGFPNFLEPLKEKNYYVNSSTSLIIKLDKIINKSN